MNVITPAEESETFALADAARELGVTVQVALSLVQRGLLDGRRVGGKWRFTSRAIDTCRHRLALEHPIEGAPAHPSSARLLRARAAAMAELRAIDTEVASARAGNDFEAALALEQLRDLVTAAPLFFDPVRRRWAAEFATALPNIAGGAA
jgi:hypothetical protein